MKNKITVSTLINHVVTTIDLMFKGRYPQYLLDYLYLITYGMILNYGDSNIEKIYDSLKEVEFILDNISGSPAQQIGENFYFSNLTDNNYLQKIYNFKNSSHTIFYKYKLFFSEVDNSKIKTLEYMTYYLNSILFDNLKKVGVYDSIKISFDFVLKGVRATNFNNESAINKVFNALRTENIINYLLEIKDTKITNRKFSNALVIINGISKDSYSVEGLNILVNLFRPIYECEETRLIVDSLNDKILIEDEFDRILGKNSYKKVCDRLEILNRMVDGCSRGNEHNYYELSIEFLAIRNDFINRYIKLKYA